jgi:hypothetical protein
VPPESGSQTDGRDRASAASDRQEHRRARRAEKRAATRRRRRAAAAASLALLAVAVALILAPGSPSRHAPHTPAKRPPGGRASARLTPARRNTAPVSAAARAVAVAGRLEQTHAFPSSRSPLFRSLMAALWEGVSRGSVEPALVAFFPEQAYLQLKAINGAASDWQSRLVHDYALDIAAAHRLLGGNGSRARFVRVDARSEFGHWIPPGVCSNSVGYYEMPNARVIYREGSRMRSFGIASLISWRGEWYVVHLGAILRPSDAGLVNAPSAGSGVQVYSSTC